MVVLAPEDWSEETIDVSPVTGEKGIALKTRTSMFGGAAPVSGARTAATRRCLTVLGGAAVIAVAAPAAALAAGPPSITSAFTPSSIGVGGTSALSFTITNPNASGSLTSIGFTDTLPAGVVVDNPNGQNGTCGSTGTLTAISGSSTITLSGGKLAAGASCTVSAAVTSNTPGVAQNTTGPVSSSAGNGNSETESLTVIAPPTISLNSPANNATVNFGQKVIARYSCQEAINGPGIVDCSANIDDNDATVASGSPIDTSTPGAHTFTVSATSDDGQVSTDTVNYTVRPNNKFVVSHLKPHPGGDLSLQIAVPGPGTVELLESAPKTHAAHAEPRLSAGNGRFVFARKTIKVRQAKTVKVTLAPDANGASLLKTDSSVVIRLLIAYEPAGGLSRTATFYGIKLTS